MPSVASPGVTLDLGVGYRVNPKWAVMWSGQYAELTSERADAARAFTGTLAAQYHFAPTQRVNPWFEFGAGYKFFEDPATQSQLPHPRPPARSLARRHRLPRRRGRLPRRLIGGDATYFLFQDVPGAGTNIPDPTVSTFVYAGLQGRFDISTATPTGATTTAKRSNERRATALCSAGERPLRPRSFRSGQSCCLP